MIYKIGQKVYFHDPDNNISSGIYEVIASVTVGIVLLKNDYTETEAYLHEIKPLDNIYVCKNCNSANIQQRGWYNINDNSMKVTDIIDDECYYCENCDEIINEYPQKYKEYESKN